MVLLRLHAEGKFERCYCCDDCQSYAHTWQRNYCSGKNDRTSKLICVKSSVNLIWAFNFNECATFNDDFDIYRKSSTIRIRFFKLLRFCIWKPFEVQTCTLQFFWKLFLAVRKFTIPTVWKYMNFSTLEFLVKTKLGHFVSNYPNRSFLIWIQYKLISRKIRG